MRIWLPLLSIWMLWTTALLAQEAPARIALVVGNAEYSAISSLDNAGNDARLIADTLTGSGFEVTLLMDISQSEFKRAVADFGRRLRSEGPDTVGLFYFAGHGVQSFGQNYLLPVDASLSDAADLDLVALEANAVLRQMASARNATNIMILDACRNNPFVTVRDLNDNGLAEMNASKGMFLSYATGPGAVALDGSGSNSPFSAALAEAMRIEGMPIEQVFKTVRVRVLEETGGLQTPWVTSLLTTDFAFRTAAPKTPEQLAEERLWTSVKETRDPVQIMLFLRTHPGGTFEAEARSLLESVMSTEFASASPEPEPAPAQNRQVGPTAAETEMFEAARTAGTRAAYEGYLDAFPTGVFSEIARIELAGLAPEPAAPEPAEDVATPTPETPTAQLTYATPMQQGTAAILGLTIEEAANGEPLFPPIEGLPDEVWKDQPCAACHQWTRDALCTQANTYLTDAGQTSLQKPHPYGGTFKQNLKRWATGGCQ